MMSSLEIEAANIPNLQKIETFLSESSYRETLEVSASFNTRLCIERRSRLPFLDPQTGVAQRHCQLYMSSRQRMPGHGPGQIYSYPSSRWRKSKRQYLQRTLHSLQQQQQAFRPFRGFHASEYDDPMMVSLHHDDSTTGSLTCDTVDLKDTSGYKDDGSLPKDWLYDEIDMNDMDGTDKSEQGDSDYDYNINGYKRKTSSSRRKSRPTSERSRKSEGGSSGSSRRSRPSASSSSRSRSRKKSTPVEQEPDFQDRYMPAFEPPSFQSAAEGLGDVNGDLRSYRKY